jgi:hypothetical protein
MSEVLTRYLTEVGQNRSLYGDGPRRLREGEEPTHRDHIVNAIAQAHKEGAHETGRKLSDILEEMDDGADEPEEGEEREDESEAGRGEPRKPLGQVNTAGSSRGKENMESRERYLFGGTRHGIGLRESRANRRLREWAARVLRG